MTADINDKLRKYKSRFSTTLSTGIGTGTSDTFTPATVTGLPTDTAITIFIDRVDSTGTKTPTKLEAIKGVVSGGNITSYVRAVEGTEQAHSGGAVIEMVWNAADWNDVVDWGLAEHNQDGTHAAITADSVTSAGAIEGASLELAAGAVVTEILDEDDMASDSATKLATQQSIKAYVDSEVSGITVPVKTSGADITTGTNDTNFATPKALADATVGKLGAAWTTFDPTFGGVNVGSTGTKSGAYVQIGKTVHFRANFVLGGTSISVGTTTLTLPVAIKNTYTTYGAIGVGAAFNGLDSYCIYITSNGQIFYYTTGGTAIIRGNNLTSSAPFTWAAGHLLQITGTYEIA